MKENPQNICRIYQSFLRTEMYYLVAFVWKVTLYGLSVDTIKVRTDLIAWPYFIASP